MAKQQLQVDLDSIYVKHRHVIRNMNCLGQLAKVLNDLSEASCSF